MPEKVASKAVDFLKIPKSIAWSTLTCGCGDVTKM
jgi:hypothetical protein